MKDVKLGVLPYILLICCLAFVLVKIRDARLVETSVQASTTDSLTLISSDEWNQLAQNTEKVKNEKCLLIYDENNENSLETYKNIEYVLDSIGVEVVPVKIEEQNVNLYEFDTMVVCIEALSDLRYSSTELKNWTRSGKGIYFTMPLQNDEYLAECSDLLGIKEGSEISTIDYSNITFEDDFLILAKNQVFYEETINGLGLKVELEDEVSIHATEAEENGNPILWNLEYGDGFVSVCNAYLLQDKVSRGIIVAGYSELHNCYVYPVINSSMYCIDDLPSPIPTGYNKIIEEQYNCNMEDFYFNIWWPKMKSFVDKYGIKYSGYVIQTYEDDIEPPYDNKIYLESSKYYANALISSGGELGIHGYNHQSLALEGFDYRDEEVNYKPWKSLDNIFEATRAVISYAKELAPSASVTSYVAPSNIISSYVQKELEKNVQDLKVYAGVYIGNESTMLQEFEAIENGIVYVPRTDSGMDISMDIQSDFLMCNELSYHYVHSNFFHPDDVLDVDRGADKGFEELCKTFEQMVKNLNSTGIRNTTVTEGGAAVQRYELTSCNQNYEDGILELEVNGIKDEVYYLIKLNNDEEIKNIEGAEYQKINDNYYSLKIKQKNVVIEME